MHTPIPRVLGKAGPQNTNKYGTLLKLRGQNSTTKGSFLTPLAESTMHRLKKGHFDPGALVMNLTQIVAENDCIWGQSDYSRSQMNDSFWVKNDYCQGQNKEMTPEQGCK